MDRININNLFSTNRIATEEIPLDVNSLYVNDLPTTKKIDFSIDNLLSHKKEKKKKVKEYYKKIYNIILKKIQCVNKINDTTDIIYDVPELIFGLKEYNHIECIDYIQTNLRNLYHMDTLKLSNNKSIFISWKNIEENRQKHILNNQQTSNTS
jgi:hypothetical protein